MRFFIVLLSVLLARSLFGQTLNELNNMGLKGHIQKLIIIRYDIDAGSKKTNDSSIYTFDSEGKVIEHIYFYTSFSGNEAVQSNKYTYPTNNQKDEYEFIDNKNDYQYLNKYIYQFDDNGNIIKEKRYAIIGGELMESITYEYSSNVLLKNWINEDSGNVIRYEKYDLDGNLLEDYEPTLFKIHVFYKYNKNSINVTSINLNNNEKIEKLIKIKTDKSGNPIIKEYYIINSSGKISKNFNSIEEYQYEYFKN